ncbi:MAG: ATP-binding protein [Bacteroidales bacterium]
MIKRTLQAQIEADFIKNKVQLLFGPRQIGKTTLINSIYKNFEKEKLWLNADDADVREMFVSANSTKFKQLFGKYKLLVIDEAQRLENAGLAFKIIADELKSLHVIATGSSAFELGDKIKESMTGRAIEYKLLPFWMQEMIVHTNIFEEKRILGQRIIYGYYPDVVNNPGDERQILQQITGSVLYKDLYALTQVKKPYLLEKILIALALQIGNEVSFNELSNTIGADKETIEKYIFLLEQAFVIYRLPSLSRNLRSEINKGRKIYFYDNGVRNSLINNFSPLNLRSDKGALWENFLMAERLKKVLYQQHFCNRYFWRTNQQQEIDYIEESDGILNAYEFKYSPNSKARLPLTFARAYTEHCFNVINTDNYDAFVAE